MKSKSITIVSHLYCPPGCDVYEQHYRWQAASFIHATPSVMVDWCVYLDEDSLRQVQDTWQHVFEHYSSTFVPTIVQVPLSALLRRAIVRNLAAKHSTTDVIWFADLDYQMLDGCIDAICEQVGPDDGLFFPGTVLENIDHETGERMVEENRNVQWPKVDPSLFKPRKRKFALGGLQIVGGNTARRIGYLPNTKWQQPADPSRGWHQTAEDRIFRAEFPEGSKAIDVPNLYWIRHNTKGADLDGDGNYVGKEAW